MRFETRWHTKQSYHNHDAYELLSAHSQHKDWQITALFYSTIHVIDEYLLSIGEKPCNHTQRRGAVKLHLNGMYQDYMYLDSLCRKARYEVLFNAITGGERLHAVKIHDSIRAHVQSKMR